MVDTTDTAADQSDDDSCPVADEYLPMYEHDPDAGPSYSRAGEVVCKVPRAPQVAALQSIAGQGLVEPDGWVRAYNEIEVPVIDGVPVLLLSTAKKIRGGSEGVESWGEYVVDTSLGTVEVHRAGRHPTNGSKLKVNEKVLADPEDVDGATMHDIGQQFGVGAGAVKGALRFEPPDSEADVESTADEAALEARREQARRDSEESR